MTLPFLISVPHGGLWIPPEVEDLCILTPEQVAKDGDEGATEIYAIGDQVAAHVAAEVARAIVDPNRAPNDFSKDGVIKTHTCWNEPIYHRDLPPGTRRTLLERYWRPYHAELSRHAGPELILGVDCHTMAAQAPPVGPDPGAQRPPLCLSNGDGTTCTSKVFEQVAQAFENAFGVPVSRNTPFRGGHIIHAHADEMPWVQLELSRAPFTSQAEKRAAILAALRELT
jgi:formiminoglutamase